MKNLKWVISSIVLTFIGLFLWNVNFTEVLVQISSIGFNFIWILLVTFIAYLFATLSWKNAMINPKTSLWRLFIIRHMGEVLSIVNPSNIIAGEALKIYYLKGSGQKDNLESIVLSRYLIIIASILLVAYSLMSLAIDHIQTPVQYLLVFTIISIAIMCVLFIYNKTYLFKIVRTLIFPFRKSYGVRRILIKIKKLNFDVAQFATNNPKRITLALILVILHWLLGALEIYLIFLFIDIPIDYHDAITMEMGITTIKSCASFIPGQLGIEEYANKLMMGIIGVDFGMIWITVSVLRRSRQVFWILIGIIFFLLFNPVPIKSKEKLAHSQI